MFTLKNEFAELSIDERGCLHTLKNLGTGRNYAAGKPVWNLYYQLGLRTQNEVVCAKAPAKVAENNEELTLTWDKLETKDGHLAIRVTMKVKLWKDESRWSVEVENQADGVLVKEIQYPLLGNCRISPDQKLICTANGGERYDNAKAYIFRRARGTRAPYQDEDYNGIQVQTLYPGSAASCNCYLFASDEQGLYCGSHDDSFRSTVHLWRILNDDLEVGFAKHLFLKKGEKLNIDGFVLSPYSGSWHVAAKKYRSWADTWFKTGPRPDWLETMTGWQRIILKHQNCEVHYNYDQLPEIFRDGAKSGIDCLFMFGWWRGGMDRLYPEYEADSDMGGFEELKRNIKIFQEELGGKVIMYSSGRLVDKETEFYKRIGHKLSIKTAQGGETACRCMFNNKITYERLYGAPELTAMCLVTEEWQAELRRFADIAIELGCKGVFYDQLGLQEYPCCDPSHGHPVPYITQTEGKRRVIADLRKYVKDRAPDMAFGVEVFADAVAQGADFVHGLYLQNYFASNPDWEEKAEKPRTRNFIEWSRYTYPEVIVTDRDIRDDTDIERRVNHCVLKGLRHDVEIYRCRKSVAETPHYQKYLGEISALRERCEDLLLRGVYVDTDGFSIDNPEIDATSFELGNRKAVVLAQSHLKKVETKVTVPGWCLSENDGVSEFSVEGQGGAVSVTLGKHGLAVLIFEKMK